MTYSKINLEILFPKATDSEIRPWLSKRSRTVINQTMLRNDTQEYSYKILPKIKGREKYNVTKWFNKEFPKEKPL